MQHTKIVKPVLVMISSLAAAVKAAATDELKIAYNVGVAPLKFEDAASRPAGLFPDLWRLWAQNYLTNIFEYHADKPLFSQVYYTASPKATRRRFNRSTMAFRQSANPKENSLKTSGSCGTLQTSL